MAEPISQPGKEDISNPPGNSTESGAQRLTVKETRAVPGPSAVPPLSPQRYLLGEQIASGGMGTVYRATDTALGREVAVKVLQERFAHDSGTARRFADEARIAAQLQHPGIPPVHDLGTLPDGRPFLSMKLIKGSTLADRLQHRPDLETDRAAFVAVFEAVCQAVGYAHAHKVIHRDLKPSNIMVGAFGEVQVMDWGLAKVLGEREPAPTSADPPKAEDTRAWTRVSPLPQAGSHTEAGDLVGTAAFIPPEQAVGQIERVNERSDVFGLGAVLAVILTGKPPYVGETVESVRIQAVRGNLVDCFARLDASSAEPELIALCKKCLAFEPDDRPRHGGEVGQAVAALRAAADERARRAELERVRVEGEKAAAEARTLERRKRRRALLVAAVVLALAALASLASVLAMQRRANADLAAKNRELADKEAKVQARFELAQKAIATFHTGVSEDVLLKNEQFQELRTKLLKEAAAFYTDLQNLLEGDADTRSRQLLAEGYSQLGELTEKIGDQRQALAVHNKALAVRRELAAGPEAELEARLNVARSLASVGRILLATGDPAGALRAREEQRDIARALETQSPTDAVQQVLADSQTNIGVGLSETGKPAEALAALEQARDIWQKLADANPGDADYKRGLAHCHNNIAISLYQTGKRDEAVAAWQKALDIQQKLADANPANTLFRSNLAATQNNIGIGLYESGKRKDGLAAIAKAQDVWQKLADANPAVTQFQSELALSYYNIGNVLGETGKPNEALAEYEKARDAYQKLADANPTVIEYQSQLATVYYNIGDVLRQAGKPAEALAAWQKALPLHEKLADANPTIHRYQRDVSRVHTNIGRLLSLKGQLDEGWIHLNTAVAKGTKIADANPTITDYASGLAESHAYRGWVRLRNQKPKESATDLRRAVELWAKDATLSPELRFERSRALALLAKLGQDTASGVTAPEAKALADQAVDALREAVKAGWSSRPAELKGPDFDAVRDHDDFRKLLADVEQKAADPGKDRGPM
jgi:tetratricopeptide (TPR) repeat protein